MNVLAKAHVCLTVTMLSCVLFLGCASVPDRATLVTPELRPGVAAGYLQPSELPDSVALLPPPPTLDSAAYQADLEASEVRKVRGSERWVQAQRDAVLSFPEAAGIFECAIGAPISEEGTPHLYRLLRRSRTDSAAVSDAAKDKYRRIRPFVVNREESCTPDKEAGLAQNGSYPSGHTSIGWAWALILTQVAPARTNEVLERGRSFGQSRVVCNVHWKSDVEEGRTMGAAVVARMQSNPEFLRDVKIASEEVMKLRSEGMQPTRDCDAEFSALAH